MDSDELQRKNEDEAGRLTQQARDIERGAVVRLQNLIVSANTAHELRRKAAVLAGFAPHRAIIRASENMPDDLWKLLVRFYGDMR